MFCLGFRNKILFIYLCCWYDFIFNN